MHQAKIIYHDFTLIFSAQIYEFYLISFNSMLLFILYENLGSLFCCCCYSVTKSCPNLCEPMNCSMLGFSVLHNLPELVPSNQWCMPSNHLIVCCPLLLLPSIFPSIKVFSSEPSLHIRLPKCWSFSFSISPSKEYLGLISFRIDLFDLLAVQGTLKSLLQYHGSKGQFFGAKPSLWFNSHIHIDYWKIHSFEYMYLCQQDDVSAF